ncbi:hypothetical protein AAVH_06847 [Aphelenchoides avenae]|nr:hypothetical protein AAVH_06847 [Aphelenchus avenae]
MNVVSGTGNGKGHAQVATGEPVACFVSSAANVTARSLTSVGFSNETLTWRAYVDTEGSLLISSIDDGTEYTIEHFVTKQAYKDSVLRSDYSLEDSAYLFCSFSGTQFSLARIQNDQLMVLDPLGFVYSTGGFGIVGGYFLDETQLHVWYYREGPQRVVYVSTFGFDWNVPTA